jgi:hypothetical protein
MGIAAANSGHVPGSGTEAEVVRMSWRVMLASLLSKIRSPLVSEVLNVVMAPPNATCPDAPFRKARAAEFSVTSTLALLLAPLTAVEP